MTYLARLVFAAVAVGAWLLGSPVWAKELSGPSASAVTGDGKFLKLDHSHETKPTDILAYYGDLAHCDNNNPPVPPHHCPPQTLVKAYRVKTTFKIHLKRKYVRGPRQGQNKSLDWQVLGPMIPRDVPADGKWSYMDGQSHRISEPVGGFVVYPEDWDKELKPVGLYEPALSQYAKSPSTKYGAGDPDFFIAVANLMSTVPNADVCLSSFRGPAPKTCSSSGANDSEKAVKGFVGAMSAQSRDNAGQGSPDAKAHAHKQGEARTGAHPNHPHPEFHEFEGTADQQVQCCNKWVILQLCNEELWDKGLPRDSVGKSNTQEPDCEWTLNTGITDVPTCTGTGLAGGIEYKYVLIHTEVKEGQSHGAVKAVMDVIIDTVLKPVPGGGYWAALLFNAAKKGAKAAVNSLGTSRQNLVEVLCVESTWTPGLNPPVTWGASEHTSAASCPPIILPQIDLPGSEGTGGQ